MTHAIIYDRASTILQKDNYSRVNAKEYGIKIAEQNGFTWEYVKEIGSGTTLTGRPEMMRILDRTAAGEVQAIIVQELDRLARPEEAVVYSTIRNTIMAYNVIIYTHTSRVDLNNDDDDFVADITMSVAKKERRRIRKRMKRGMMSRAESGKFACGRAGLGYVVTGNGSKSDLEIEPEGAKLVRRIFATIEATGGNLHEAAKRLNEKGYRGAGGGAWRAHTIKRTVARKLLVGILETNVTDKVTYRPDLQIITVNQFGRVQELIKSRAGQKRDLGRRGKYPLTGFVCCGGCGGAMVAANRGEGGIVYQCVARRHYGKAGCESSKTYAENLILPPIIDFLAGFLFEEVSQVYAAINEAAALFGKTVTEEALEAAVRGELESVKAGKQRIVEAISLGVLSVNEAGAKLESLRAQEDRLTLEIAGIAEKAAIMEQWQEALEAVKGKDREQIATQLVWLAEKQPIAFRRFLSLIFEPNSLKVRTWRVKAHTWQGALEGHELTAAMKGIKGMVSFDNNSKYFVQSCQLP